MPHTTDYRALGRIGFEKYSDAADWKNYAGDPIPQWDDLPEDIRVKWTVAAMAITDADRAAMTA